MLPKGTIVQCTFSKCCNVSVSGHNGKENSKGEFIPLHHTCNKCGKVTEAIKKDAWIITEKGLIQINPLNFKNYKLL